MRDMLHIMDDFPFWKEDVSVTKKTQKVTKEIQDDIKFLLSLLPTWAIEVPAGFDPTFYGTGSYAGDLGVNKRVREIKDRYVGKDDTKLNFKYRVEGNHPIFMYINRRCLTLSEAENVKEGLLAVGYEVEIKEIGVEK